MGQMGMFYHAWFNGTHFKLEINNPNLFNMFSAMILILKAFLHGDYHI